MPPKVTTGLPTLKIADRIARTTPVVPFVVCVVASDAMKRSRARKAKKKSKARKIARARSGGYIYSAARPRRVAVLRSGPMAELTFLVEDAPEGGFTARAEGFSIFTEADSWADLSAQVHDAVRCHFDEGKAPATIRARYKDQELSL